jgi:hypothetical protein
MGDVYRARDTRLNRDVAIKVLAPRLATDALALARFEREAQTLAALSNPHIVTVYDVGRHDDSAFVVMEYLDGQNLRQRLAEGPIQPRKAVDYAIQLARGLAVAHQHGIVHRDLKPENIFLTTDGPLKILDLGLAILATRPTLDTAETVASAEQVTEPGTVVGTVGYMAPEQARGLGVDARTDIFAFGAVLYEMVSGRRAFDGDTPVDLLTAVIHDDPPNLAPGTQVSSGLERIIRRCLEKRPEDRFESTRDLAFALEGVAAGSSGTIEPAVAPRSRPRLTPSWALALLGAALALAAGLLAGHGLWGRVAPAASVTGPVRFSLAVKRGTVPEVTVSPDGRHLAWTALADPAHAGGLWVRRLDEAEPQLLADTAASGSLFWSPDGREIVCIERDLQLTAIDVERGSRRLLHTLDPSALPIRGGDWEGDRLLIGSANVIVMIDFGGGGVRRPMTSLDRTREHWHGWPRFLPDGRRLLYTAGLTSGAIEARIASLDGGRSVPIALPPTITRALYDARGYLLFVNNGALFAQRVDLETGGLHGAAVRLAPEALQNRFTGWGALDVSRNGVLTWRAPGVDLVRFEWVDRNGRTLSLLGEANAYTNFDLSPDGQQVVTTLRQPDAGSALYLLNSPRNTATLISAEHPEEAMSDPTLSPDGRQVAYRHGTRLVVRATAGGEERTLADWAGYPDSWSRDGRYLALGRPRSGQYDLIALAMDGSGEEIPLVTGVALADEPRFSPDGQWVAFHAAAQRSPEVYAIRFPPTGERWQLSANGGVQPRWRADGRELYYLAPGGQMMAVPLPTGDPSRAGRPQPLFDLRFDPSAAFDQFAPSADGQRFVIRRPLRTGSADTAPVHVLVNWVETLGRGPER